MDSPLIQLRKFFSQGTRGEVSLPEFTQFFKACSEQEREEMKTAMGLWDGKSEFIPLNQPVIEKPAVASVAA